jgi:peroxiredoxin
VFWRHVVVPNQSNRQLSSIGARYNLSLIRDQSLSLSGYERNHLFQQLRGEDGPARFLELAAQLGADSNLDGRGVAAGDIDGDGDQDLAISNRNYPHVTVLRNDYPAGRNHFLAVEARGSASNTMAVGARIRATCGGEARTRVVSLGAGFLSQSDTRVWFGLGACDGPVELDVRWPFGGSSRFEGLAVDRIVRVDESRETFTEIPTGPRNPTLDRPPPVHRPAAGELPPLDMAAPAWSLPPAQSTTAEPIRYPGGSSATALPRTLLVNFWATWCAPCAEEIADLVALRPRLAELGAEVVGISVDDASSSTVGYYARSMNIPYPVVHDRGGAVFREYVELLELGAGSVPLSLIVHDGRIRRVYRGRVEPDEVVAELQSLLAETAPR